MIVAQIGISLLPVLGFLAVLVFMDSYKLVSFRSVLLTILVGAAAAGICYALNSWLGARLDLSPRGYSRYMAPLVEETLKALYVVSLIRRHRVGFLVDAAIYGFAVGTGFALTENAAYLHTLWGQELWLWIVRGLGTAIMHGSTTAIFGIVTKGLVDRRRTKAYPALAPGLLLAIALHSFFNHFLFNPLLMTALMLALLPLLVIVVFERSERATRDWLGVGFDTDIELLQQIATGEIRDSRVGRHLESLKSTFPAIVVADMLCLLQIHLELSVRAKGLMLARQAGVAVEPDEGVRANLEELRYLENSVGKTGKLALHSFINLSSRDLWQIYVLDSRT